MPRRDPVLNEAIREVADLLATAWLRLHLPDLPQCAVEFPETQSPHVEHARRDQGILQVRSNRCHLRPWSKS